MLVNILTIVFSVVVGVLGKVVYDRLFARRPDLRYVFGVPAQFGTGDRQRIYQNLEVSNVGAETTTDVRIIFSLPLFDLAEHQVTYTGPQSIERTEDQVAIVIPSLPPGDSATFSFVFHPSKIEGSHISRVFLSAKSKECVAKPVERRTSKTNEWLAIVMGFLLVSLALYHVYDRLELLKERLKVKNQLEKIQSETNRTQTPEQATRNSPN